MAETTTWQQRIDEVWASATELDATQLIERIDAIAAERPADDPSGLFERAGARDSAGLEGEAEGLYRAAIANGLEGELLVQATIQLASTLRNLGRASESLELLEAIEGDAGELGDAVSAFRALALIDLGEPERASARLLTALAPHLPRYRVSVAAYAEQITASA